MDRENCQGRHQVSKPFEIALMYQRVLADHFYLRCVSPKKDVTDDYNVYIQEQLKRIVRSGDCPGC